MLSALSPGIILLRVSSFASLFLCILLAVMDFFFLVVSLCLNVLPVQALYEALMRQEELLAYIDRQEEARLRVSRR